MSIVENLKFKLLFKIEIDFDVYKSFTLICRID